MGSLIMIGTSLSESMATPARPTFHTYPATFELSDLRGVHGQRLYLRFSVSYTGNRPDDGEAPWGDMIPLRDLGYEHRRLGGNAYRRCLKAAAKCASV